MPPGIFERWGLDFVGPIVPTKTVKRYIVVKQTESVERVLVDNSARSTARIYYAEVRIRLSVGETK